jgi:hypothetical protein
VNNGAPWAAAVIGVLVVATIVLAAFAGLSVWIVVAVVAAGGVAGYALVTARH